MSIPPVMWGEFLVNTIKDGAQSNVQLQTLDNGRFLAVWQNETLNELGVTVSSIYAQEFYSGAVAKGDPILINTTVAGSHSNPVVTVLSDGRLVYAWEHQQPAAGGGIEYSIKARIFNANGTPFDINGDEEEGTEEFTIASGPVPLAMPLIKALSDGRFAITYNDAMSDTTDAGVKVAVYGADGLPIGAPISVNSVQAGTQTSASLVSLSGNRFLSIYKDEGAGPDEMAFIARVLSTDGTSVTAGAETAILTGATTVTKNTIPTATLLSDGRIIVAWTEIAEDGNSDDVRAQVFTIDPATGELRADGAAFIVSSQQEGHQSAPTITALSRGGFAISYLETDGSGVPQVRVAIFDQNKNHLGNDTILSKPFADGVRSAPKLIELNDGRLIVAWDEDISGRSDDADGIRGQVLDARFQGINMPGTTNDDQYVGTEFNDTLGGGSAGRDHLNGREGNDILEGGSENDTLNGGEGVDRMIGGTGDDVYYVDNAYDVIVEHAGQGNDTVYTTFTYTLSDPNLENLVAEGSAAIGLTGNALNNVITGNSAANVINGGAGADTMRGGAGDDTYVVDNAGDVIADDSGIDTVMTSISYALAENGVENLVALGAAGIGLTGNALNNAITGNAGANIINGGFGNDTLTGGKGKDIFVFNTAPDKAANLDRIVDFNVKDDSIYLDNAIFGKLGKKGSEFKPAKLNKKFFTIGKKAKDKDDYLVYDNKKGVLYYDADGKGKGKAVEIAQLDKKLKMTYKDFFVI